MLALQVFWVSHRVNLSWPPRFLSSPLRKAASAGPPALLHPSLLLRSLLLEKVVITSFRLPSLCMWLEMT